jgi:tetratricopeptide (TPR) repeat protein
MPESLRIPGRRIDPPVRANAAGPFGVTTTVKCLIAVEPPVRGAENEYQTLAGLDPGGLMELEFPGGVRRWVSVAQLQDELRPSGTRGEGGVLELPPNFGASAGGVKSVAELLIEFPADYAADLGARKFVERVEGKLTAGPGLTRISDPRQTGVRIDSAAQIQDSRVLLFIHGTASDTLGSFGDLSGTAEWERLAKSFPGSIYALEHRTLSESPIENAIQAATLLPAGATLNLVTHSRGGLVGELLCLPVLTDEQRNIFDKDRAKDQQDLQRLAELLQEKQFKVERFVRVACPARGTLLASKRLDLYLSVLLNLIGKLPIFQGNPFYQFMEATLKKLIALKADPYELPGLEAQMPDSPLIHLLNRPDIASKADLAVITGDSHGGPIFQALSTFAVDVFFRQKHDFVVNTSAMYGGISRAGGGYYFDDSGAGVCHFHYFKNEKTRQQMNAWLEAKSNQGSGEFVKLAYRERNLIFPSLRGGNNLPNLIFIPGLLGTHLQSGGDTIWLNSDQLLPGALDRIAFGKPVTIGPPLAYQQEQSLKDLNTSFQVMSFGYDWRLPLRENADRLAEVIQKQLDESQNATHLLAHASGAILVEILEAEHPEVWKEFRNRGGRATPVGDAAQAARQAEALIRGTHKLARLLQLLDRRPAAEIGNLFGEMPGVREVAAHSVQGTTVLEEEDLGTPLLYPTEQDLADAVFGTAPATGQESIRIRLRAKHGHLREADFPVAVGHYLGDGIVSAEKVLDQQLGGRLSENFQLDLYPGRNGTTEVFESPGNHPPGALVIGLGEVGEIGTDKVRRGVAAAALRYALGRLRSAGPEADRLSLGISALLLGTYGGNALSVRDSIEAIAEGVVQANHALRAQKLWDGVRIETIEFVELYEDLAIQAAHEIIKLEKRSRRDAQAQPAKFIAEREMQTAAGGLFHRPGNPYQSGWWRRIRVQADEEGLAFTVLTDRARADFSLKPTQRELVAACVDKAVSATQYDADLARVLFDILLPKGIKDQIRDRTNLVFIVDRSSAHFPWEMLAQRAGDTVEPLANRIGMIRQLVSKDPPKLRTSRKMAATVVGAPFFKEPSRWPKLPGAKQEAQAVADKLTEAKYEVNTLLAEAATPLAILAAVLANSRILHLAGHGVYNEKEPERSGFVIGEDLYLSAAEITSVEPVPELVFLNCCYGGSIPKELPGAGQPHRLAGTLATELIAMGVKAVVVSGWAVDDRAAQHFALEFYDGLLGGSKFGDAVLRARASTFQEFPKTNTWGAYQCYGNPDFALDLNLSTEDSQAADQTVYVARREVLERVRNIEARAVDVDDAKRAKLLTELATIDRTAAGKWDDGEMLFEIASAYAALQSNEEALEAFNKSFAQSKVPVKAVEQLANLLYRKAETVEDEAGHAALFEQARKYVQWTLELHPTVERLCLMGSLYKRESVWRLKKGSVKQRDLNLEKALEWYARACDPQKEKDPDFNAYPALNAAAIQLLLGKADQDWADRVARIAACSKERALDGSVWDRTGLVDAALLLEMQGKTFARPPVQDDLIKRYRNAFQSATRRQRDSVVSQMRVIRDLLDATVYSSEIAGLNRVIEALEIKTR